MTTLLARAEEEAPTGAAPGRPRLARSASRWRRVGVRILATGVLLALWQLLYSLQIWSPVLLPSPGAVWEALVRTSTTNDGVVGYQGHYLIDHLGISLGRIGLGSLFGVAAGLVVGLLMGTLPWVRVVVEPWVTFLRTLPPLAYFSLLIIWLGIDESPKIWLLGIAAMPPVAVATAAAVVGAPATLVEAARAMGASRWQTTISVVLPSALPEISTGVRLAVGIAYSSLVAAETVNGLPGIGGMIRQAQAFNQSDVVILGLFAIGISGLLIDAALRAVERRVVPWRGRA
ncbi:ABC transporter permease [Klenkia brasiliensis]|uniref:Taurine transport system permease protein n=1 Tax=Klenkia brasiliensis TaxID=333142 RepID=A0A1G7USW5_9ACTN|nr:ABC transporter permease [Klenkia brasiliensis]SDG50577.1 taurine transport system permease protein [Klenkia brasiliensis]